MEREMELVVTQEEMEGLSNADAVRFFVGLNKKINNDEPDNVPNWVLEILAMAKRNLIERNRYATAMMFYVTTKESPYAGVR